MGWPSKCSGRGDTGALSQEERFPEPSYKCRRGEPRVTCAQQVSGTLVSASPPPAPTRVRCWTQGRGRGSRSASHGLGLGLQAQL